MKRDKEEKKEEKNSSHKLLYLPDAHTYPPVS
jgi:hypothetical protein